MQHAHFVPGQSSCAGAIGKEDQKACSRRESKQHAKNHESGDHLLHVIELQRRDDCQTNPHPLASFLLWNRPRGEHWESFRGLISASSPRLSFTLLAILDAGTAKRASVRQYSERLRDLNQNTEKNGGVEKSISAAICARRASWMRDGRMP